MSVLSSPAAVALHDRKLDPDYLPSRRVTTKDIAAAVGVGQASVSAVLNGAKGKHVAEDTRQRILQAAEEMGYRRNAGASVFKTGRFGSVALLLSVVQVRSFLPLELLDGIHDALGRHDLHLMLTRLPDDELCSQGFIPKVLREWSCDGLLINYIDRIPEPLVDHIEKFQFPAVWLNSQREHDAVHPDDRAGGALATRYLLEMGHRHIVYRTINSTHYSDAARCAGYKDAMRSAGLEPRVVGAPEFATSVEGYFALAEHLKTLNPLPTAIVDYHETSTQADLLALFRAGWKVPEDISVMTFAPQPMYSTHFTVTTCMLPERQMGDAAVEMLLRKIESPDLKLPAQILPYGIAPGVTCAPPKAS